MAGDTESKNSVSATVHRPPETVRGTTGGARYEEADLVIPYVH